MLISYNWLQEYFDAPLPKANILAELFTLHSFEVESVEERDGDHIFDIDILPNRAHDCLSHRGVAREAHVITGLPLKQDPPTVSFEGGGAELSLYVEEPFLCRRYIGRRVENVTVQESPEWLRKRLEAIGERSINNVVDITNFVMFDIGQPMHAFDADKVDGSIVVRKAEEGEKITLLDGKEVKLIPDTLVIADEKGPLAIAGVKGGKKAEVDASTRNIILEAANFRPAQVRRTSRRLWILTGSSKRFENEITPELAGEAMTRATSLVRDIAGGEGVRVSAPAELYPMPAGPYKIGVSLAEIQSILGVDIGRDVVENIFTRCGFKYESVDPIETIVKTARSLVGVPYKYGASVTYDAPRSFDSSSFVGYVYAQGGVSLPRVSVEQYFQGVEVEEGAIQPGDVVFSKNGHGSEAHELVLTDGTYMDQATVRRFLPVDGEGKKVASEVDHNGIYVGDGKIIHASGESGVEKVVEEDIKSATAFQYIRGVRRIVRSQEPRYVISAPQERLDLRIKEDVIEEIARVYGYANILTTPLPETAPTSPHKVVYYANLIKNTLRKENFSEVITYVFGEGGDIRLMNPVAEDKCSLRNSLIPGLSVALEKNSYYAPLLGLDTKEVRIYEIGTVFKKDGEYVECGFGVRIPRKAKKAEALVNAIMDETLRILGDALGIEVSKYVIDRKEGVCTFSVSKMADDLPDPKDFGDVLAEQKRDIRFKTLSPYPFVTRDIAAFAPSEGSAETIPNFVREASDGLLVRSTLFDTFEKTEEDGTRRTSYAWRLVFQSHEKTLSDEEINVIMDAAHKRLIEEGWEVR